MPSWSGILEPGSPPQFDAVRRKYLAALHAKTGRPIILHASKWTQPDPTVPPELLSIQDEDLQGIMEVIQGLAGGNLDLILHSPGGSLEAAEAVVSYLRSKFTHIRAVVPQLAMSAATMIACAADEILMGKHSFLGPIDPQIVINSPLGVRMVPTQAIEEQFDLAKKECQDPKNLGAWLPMLAQYGPDLLVQCKHVSKMARDLVEEWLTKYMFRRYSDPQLRAKTIADWLSDHSAFKSHGRHIPREELRNRGLEIRNLEDDQELQDLALSVFHATTHTFQGTASVKIIENHLGRAFVKLGRLMIVQGPPAAVPPANP
jgi:hypothetical protein